MKKIYYLIGVIASVTAVAALIAVLLKKLKISLSIEGLSEDDSCMEDPEAMDDGITVTIEQAEESSDGGSGDIEGDTATAEQELEDQIKNMNEDE